VKSIKMFGLAALAALMAMAFVGASSALATGSTALCKTDAFECPAGNTISHIHEVSVGKGLLLSSLPRIECTVLFLGDALRNAEGNALANPLLIHGHFTYTACNNFCSVSEPANQDSLIEVLRLGTELADVTVQEGVEGEEGGKGEVIVACPFFNCRYNFQGLEAHGLGPLLVGSGNGQVKVEGQEISPESGGCPAQTFLDLTTTPLEPNYISG
jgi:hypothetical protein